MHSIDPLCNRSDENAHIICNSPLERVFVVGSREVAIGELKSKPIMTLLLSMFQKVSRVIGAARDCVV